MKYFRINPRKYVQQLLVENYETPMIEIKELNP